MIGTQCWCFGVCESSGASVPVEVPCGPGRRPEMAAGEDEEVSLRGGAVEGHHGALRPGSWGAGWAQLHAAPAASAALCAVSRASRTCCSCRTTASGFPGTRSALKSCLHLSFTSVADPLILMRSGARTRWQRYDSPLRPRTCAVRNDSDEEVVKQVRAAPC